MFHPCYVSKLGNIRFHRVAKCSSVVNIGGRRTGPAFQQNSSLGPFSSRRTPHTPVSPSSSSRTLAVSPPPIVRLVVASSLPSSAIPATPSSPFRPSLRQSSYSSEIELRRHRNVVSTSEEICEETRLYRLHRVASNSSTTFRVQTAVHCINSNISYRLPAHRREHLSNQDRRRGLSKSGSTGQLAHEMITQYRR